jgi:glycosyltransferase involved in cell wall biosynthesis
MNILFIAHHLTGKTPWITVLSKKLTQIEGVNLHILSYKPGLAQEVEIKEMDGVHYTYLKVPSKKKDLLTLYRVRIRVIRDYLIKNKDKFDVIHLHGSEHQYQVATYNIGIPQVMSIQGILSEYKKHINVWNIFDWRVPTWYLGGYYEKKYLKYVGNFSCRTHWDKAFIKKVNPDAIIHHNWEILRDEFFGDYFNIDSNKVLFVGGTNPIKGIKEALQALNIVRENLDVKMIICGYTSKKALQKIIRKYNLTRITLEDLDIRGFQNASQMVETYKDSFCLLHPTYIDNSPNSVCEAQVSGLPTIASDVGGLNSLIEDRVTGLLVSLKPENIASKIIELRENKELWETISNNSRETVRKRHNPDDIIKKTFEIYQKIINI